MQKWETFSDEELLNILQSSHTYAEVLRKLGYKPYTSMNYIVKKIEEKLNYKIEHSQLQTKEEDIIGAIYGRLTIISLDKEKSKEKKRAWVNAQCECGNVINVSLNALKRGNTTSCGCYNKEINSQRCLKDMTGEICGRLTVIERDGNETPVRWLCKCSCGNPNLISVLGDQLHSGKTQSCGCLQKERARESQLLDLTGQVFGKLTALERDDTKQQGKKTYWKCQCECGNITYVQTAMLRNGNTSSCGCRRHSYGEEQISKILKNNNINYQSQYIFDDLKGKSYPLKFDFAIFNSNNELKYLIECNGPQHYKRIEYFQKEEEDFKEQIKNDNKKIEYCQSKSLPLFIIDFSKNRIIQEDEVIKKELLC